MLITIQIEVEIDDLEVDYSIQPNSLTTEYWGSVRTDNWVDVDINSIMWNGHDVEVDDYYHDILIDNILKNQD